LTAVAWRYQGGKLTQQWSWTSKAYNGKLPQGQMLSDFHAIRAMDVDGDGKDEISWGGFALGPSGTLLYSTSLTHGDRFIIDIDPQRLVSGSHSAEQLDAARRCPARREDGVVLKRASSRCSRTSGRAAAIGRTGLKT
jgi:hypothetical protein